MSNMGSAHPLVEVNVSFKLEGNPSISKGVIERTRIGDGRTDRPTDRPTDAPKRIQYSPPPTHTHTFCGGGIKTRGRLGACLKIHTEESKASGDKDSLLSFSSIRVCHKKKSEFVLKQKPKNT